MGNNGKSGILSSGHNRKLLLKRKSDVLFIYLFLILASIGAYMKTLRTSLLSFRI